MYIGNANLVRADRKPGFVMRAVEHYRALRSKGRDASKPRYTLLRFNAIGKIAMLPVSFWH
eukprot:12428119-Karenia_brevis.AAC.1